jgi:hypothetical protein
MRMHLRMLAGCGRPHTHTRTHSLTVLVPHRSADGSASMRGKERRVDERTPGGVCFGRGHDAGVRLLEGASGQWSRSDPAPPLGQEGGDCACDWRALSHGPSSFASPNRWWSPGVCVLTELSAQALTQDSLTLVCLLKTTPSRTCPVSPVLTHP